MHDLSYRSVCLHARGKKKTYNKEAEAKPMDGDAKTQLNNRFFIKFRTFRLSSSFVFCNMSALQTQSHYKLN
jgi:hypothetical protein